ncbi:cyanophycinase [Hymenobacter weizhouensis]|uniref:cyanophycinase n=1 Tax=Hymenobacter sp. YIM 151500-1 TaxID=2987689 RepID=UPI002226B85D|nr:cyanophycinase [Hymenobacter sp. YIM 151500-1]UYZ61975.1 cyanophycinase [Hymenobacter sp. YIM 151500-1]
MPQSSAFPLGTLVTLGGGDDDALLALLADLLPSPDAPVEVVTTAVVADAAATGQAYVEALQELGCRYVRHLPIDEHHPADTPGHLSRLEQAGLVFFTGGDQERITEFWAGTQAWQVLARRYREDAGLLVAGTSAGASVMPTHMIVAGHGASALTKGGLRTAPGLGLLPNLYIDQHFAERGRFGRLAHAVLQHPTQLGLGLGQETGLIIRRGRHAEVFGDGVVMVVDGSHLRGSNLGRIGRGEPVSGQNLRVHLLVAGQHFDLHTRGVEEEEKATK